MDKTTTTTTFLALDSDFFDKKTRLLWFAKLLTLLISGDIAKIKSESSMLL